MKGCGKVDYTGYACGDEMVQFCELEQDSMKHYCEDCKEEKKADDFFELMHKSPRAGLHKEIEKMYNEIEDLKFKVKKLGEDMENQK